MTAEDPDASRVPQILAVVSFVLLAFSFYGMTTARSGVDVVAFAAGLLLAIAAVSGQAWEAFGGAFAAVGIGAALSGLSPERRGLLVLAGLFLPTGLYLAWVPLRARLRAR
jgi:hypothetical protein